MKYSYTDMVIKVGGFKGEDELKDRLKSGWEVVCMAPFRMAPDPEPQGKGTTIVQEYFVVLRRPGEDS